MNHDPRIALSQELEAKQTLLDQLRALAAEDPDFFTDLVVDASIVEDKVLVDVAKATLDKLQIRKCELKRRLLAP
jgi:hypothetical protein